MGFNEGAKAERCGEGAGAKGGVEFDNDAAMAFAVIEGARGYIHVVHFFEANALCAYLDFIGKAVFGAAAFVFNRKGAKATGDGGVGVVLDNVGAASNAELFGAKLNGAVDADSPSVFGSGEVGAFVEDVAFRGGAVVAPNAFDVNERRLAFAKDDVLQAGERDNVVGFARSLT